MAQYQTAWTTSCTKRNIHSNVKQTWKKSHFRSPSSSHLYVWSFICNNEEESGKKPKRKMTEIKNDIIFWENCSCSIISKSTRFKLSYHWSFTKTISLQKSIDIWQCIFVRLSSWLKIRWLFYISGVEQGKLTRQENVKYSFVSMVA